MASRIQGITVEIGGDTTKLSKALESVNKSIKGTQSGLKDVNKLLKLDPSNTELVVQKQKMLKDAIEATKEKLATLKTAAQQANEQLANGEITQQQYDALQREIVETEQNLRSLQDQAATTNATLAKIDEAGEKLQNIGSSVENLLRYAKPAAAQFGQVVRCGIFFRREQKQRPCQGVEHQHPALDWLGKNVCHPAQAVFRRPSLAQYFDCIAGRRQNGLHMHSLYS